MNKTQKIKSLTWKYFWQQKITEVTITLLIALLIIFAPFLLGNNMGDNKDTMCGENIYVEEDCSLFLIWGEGIFYIFFVAVCLTIIAMILYFMYLSVEDWLKSNWRKADRRARRELK